MDRYAVKLTARNIEVTAPDFDAAVVFAKDDADEFAEVFDYDVTDITQVGQNRDLTTADNVDFL